MGPQTTSESYSGAMARGAVDGWAPSDRAASSASPSDPRRSGAPFVDTAESTSDPERFTTFGVVEFRPLE